MEQPCYYFKDVLCIDQYNTHFNNKVEDNKLFSANDTFYDIEIIKSIEQARLPKQPLTKYHRLKKLYYKN
jgi:hypothetical protein